MKIPGDFGVVPFVDSNRRVTGSERAGKRRRPDVIEFSGNGKRLSADITLRRTRAAGGNDGTGISARARVEQRLASGFYERDKALELIADKLLDWFGI